MTSRTQANAQTLLKLLDEAPVLAGFNAVCFDLPFIGRSLRIKQQRVDAWVAKCVDPFLGMRRFAAVYTKATSHSHTAAPPPSAPSVVTPLRRLGCAR